MTGLTGVAGRKALPEDLEFDPGYRRQRYVASTLLGIAINQLLGSHCFDCPRDEADARQRAEQIRDLAIEQGIIAFDDLHHAPCCPANHFHQRRMPTGRCTCGADRPARS